VVNETLTYSRDVFSLWKSLGRQIHGSLAPLSAVRHHHSIPGLLLLQTPQDSSSQGTGMWPGMELTQDACSVSGPLHSSAIFQNPPKLVSVPSFS
jgi:hypothetical protein